jgi:hypothetical protein
MGRDLYLPQVATYTYRRNASPATYTYQQLQSVCIGKELIPTEKGLLSRPIPTASRDLYLPEQRQTRDLYLLPLERDWGLR